MTLHIQPPRFPTDSSCDAALQAELLSGRDHALRHRIQEAGARAPEVRREIRRAAEVRPVRLPGQRAARVHLVAMPLLLDFGLDSVVCRAETRCSTPNTAVAASLRALWVCAIGAPVEGLRLLPVAVHLESALGISPLAVHEFLFFGASLAEGARTQPARLQLVDRWDRQAAPGLPACYLLLALVTCNGDLKLSQTVRPAAAREGSALLQALFATATAQPTATLLPPQRWFDALDEAHAAQMAHTVAWAAKRGLAPQLVHRQQARGKVEIECAFHDPGRGDLLRRIWAYDGTWRELPDLREVVRQAGVFERERRGLADGHAAVH